MGKKLGLGWRSSRLGLTLTWIGATLMAYVLFIHAAVTTGLIPRILGFQFFGFVGVLAIVVLAALILGLLRWAINVQADQLPLFWTFFAVSATSCAMTYFSVETLLTLLQFVAEWTPWLLLAAGAALLAGFGYCLGGGANPLHWITGVAAAAALAAAGGCALSVSGSKLLRGPLADLVDRLSAGSSPAAAGVVAAGVAVLLHAVYLRGIARRFRDESTAGEIRRFAILHIAATVLVAGLVQTLQAYRPQPVLRVGDLTYDAWSAALAAVAALAAGLDGMAFSRAIRGARALIGTTSGRR